MLTTRCALTKGVPGMMVGGLIFGFGGIIGTLGVATTESWGVRHRFVEGCIDGSLEQGKFVNCTFTCDSSADTCIDATCFPDDNLTGELLSDSYSKGQSYINSRMPELMPYTISITVSLGLLAGASLMYKLEQYGKKERDPLLTTLDLENGAIIDERNCLTNCCFALFSSRRPRLVTETGFSVNYEDDKEQNKEHESKRSLSQRAG